MIIKKGVTALKIVPVTKRDTLLIAQLTVIWENSVRATHSFLSENNIQDFKNSMPKFLMEVSHLIIALDKNNQPLGFMGINGPEIDMLFIDNKKRGQGIGKALINFGITNYHAKQITVNEQNPQAIGFYKHMGFVEYHRQITDDQGNPFPILKMRLKK
ncbi:GNAT family N-acetyltransferase [Companilactobacillus huachuanensis]|uniref:GNAT family N-acetyltransferase n=1 Tax=Companilactobacillus huachuanensis TaxID=2559914 RepID=A0ABW1RJ72_9LACO|nr:GNAT family N-acetyltransferase [Companilactobacillus huachuanensis]